jgi:UDP-N-acetylmuramate--alanine ligase
MNLSEIKYIYFIGIGGIGMSALARYFAHKGCKVAGYDRTSSSLTETLEKEGIAIHYDDDLKQIPAGFRDDINQTLVVFTPAIPSDHSELNFFRSNSFKVIKRAEVLGLITRSMRGIGIAGTHGKTTTTTLTSHLLQSSAVKCNAFLGGISKNYGTNLLLSDSKWVVIEADEYDRSFLQLTPEIAIVTSTDADHLDIYGNKSEVLKSFHQYAERIRPGGFLISKSGIDAKFNDINGITRYQYSVADTTADFHTVNLRTEDGLYHYDLVTPMGLIENLILGLPGLMNVENSVAAISAALLAGASPDEIRVALKTFNGVQRRFDYHIRRNDLVYIDDYAHHPEELKASITSARKLYPDRKLTGIFQPHLYTRTRDFAAEFAQSLSLLDELILLDIYPARELPIEGVTSNIILDKVTCKKELCRIDQVLDILHNRELDVLLTMGAGNIDRLIDPITRLLNDRKA